jgi:hypothetical protein
MLPVEQGELLILMDGISYIIQNDDLYIHGAS